ncbi:hypothetical protein NIES3787_41440 [Microcystis aeruginosa NIES-3787]|uniref:Uncharacterized protein n=1 Tax=Microcystis aeruginosa NIES-3787 TaxID=2517782 RepID=A0A6H9GMV0_MICAE|nr:hypothetical protein NIES3787_41440 [Microcystis aeruginosa NIES-3787]
MLPPAALRTRCASCATPGSPPKKYTLMGSFAFARKASNRSDPATRWGIGVPINLANHTMGMPSAKLRLLCSTDWRNAASRREVTKKLRLGVDKKQGVRFLAASCTSAVAWCRLSASKGKPNRQCTLRSKLGVY